MSDDVLQRYATLIEQYHDTLDLVSGRGLREIEGLIAEAEAYAEVIAATVGSEVTVVDVGSGAGLPGIVIAARLPAATVHLVERRRRRGAFLSMAVGRLGLANARVWTQDVKELGTICADVITAQAVSNFAAITRLTRHLHRDPCYLVSRRGPDWLSEIEPVREELGTEPTALGSRREPEPGGGRDAGYDGAADADAREALRPPVSVNSAEGDPAVSSPQAPAEATPAILVAAERRLGRGGSLVALRIAGGPACRPSG